MNPIVLAIIIVIFLVSVTYWLINTPAYRLASTLTKLFGLICLGLAAIFAYAGRYGYTAGLAGVGFVAIFRARAIAKKNRFRGFGCIRSAALEIYLPPYKAKLDGMVLAGNHENRLLTSLQKPELIELYKIFSDDEESRALLEAYLDSHFSGWGDGLNATIGDRFAGTHRSSAMTEQEAYQLLGLDPAARAADISKAYVGLLQGLRADNAAGQFIIDRLDMAQSILMSLHHQ